MRKKTILPAALLSLLLSLTGCYGEKYELVIPMSGIELSGPADGSEFDLNASPSPITFTWDKSSEGGSKLIFSDTKTLRNNVQVDAGTGTSCTVTAVDLNLIASRLGVAAGSSGKLFWTVKASSDLTAAASSIFTIGVGRILPKLSNPADQALLELDADAPEAQTLFAWEANGQTGSAYTVLFSLDPNMAEGVGEVRRTGVTGASVSLSADEIQNAVELAGIPRFTKNAVYWNVRNDSTGELVSGVAGVVNIVDMLRFNDIRGEEVQQYRVARIEYGGTVRYWMAENLRTAYAADGTALVKGKEYQSIAEDKPSWCSDDAERAAVRKAYGCYYTMDAALKACPAGWEIPSFDDWRSLFDAAGIAGSYIVLKSPQYYVPVDAKAEKADELAGAWGLNLVSAGQWWGNDNIADLSNANSQHIYILASGVPEDASYFVQSAADPNFYPQPDAARGAPVRYYYKGNQR